MTTLYRAIDLTKLVDDGGESSEPVQYVGVYVLRWGKQEYPSVGFIPVDDDMATVAPALLADNERLRAALERQRQGLVNLLEVGALPTHWDDPVHDEIAAIDAALAKGDTDG